MQPTKIIKILELCVLFGHNILSYSSASVVVESYDDVQMDKYKDRMGSLRQVVSSVDASTRERSYENKKASERSVSATNFVETTPVVSNSLYSTAGISYVKGQRKTGHSYHRVLGGDNMDNDNNMGNDMNRNTPAPTPSPTPSPTEKPKGGMDDKNGKNNDAGGGGGMDGGKEPTIAPTVAPTTEPAQSPTLEPTTSEPTTPEPTTVAPTTVAPTTPETFCFTTKSELRDAIEQYIEEDASDEIESSLAIMYGYPIGTWCMDPNMTDMSNLFKDLTTFNENIGLWNVSNIVDMSGMFDNATSFNQTLEEWNVQNVVNMEAMFRRANSFNGNIGMWSVGNVITMREMFHSALSFNNDISHWMVDQVTNMRSMFWEATSFNIDLSIWEVSRVENMRSIFYQAASFNQNLCDWGIKLPKTGYFSTYMFEESGCEYTSDPNMNVYPPGPFCYNCQES